MTEQIVEHFRCDKREAGFKPVKVKVAKERNNISGGKLYEISWHNSRKWGGGTRHILQPDEYVYEKSGAFATFQNFNDLLDYLTNAGGSVWAKLTLYDVAKLALIALVCVAAVLIITATYFQFFGGVSGAISSVKEIVISILSILVGATAGVFAGRETR